MQPSGQIMLSASIPCATEPLAASASSGEAEYQLGLQTRDELKDDKKAFDHFSNAAKLNHPKAKFELGRCYKEGKGIAADNKLAFKYLKDAAGSDLANVSAQVMLADFYKYGKEIEEFADPKKAVEYYLRAVGSVKNASQIERELIAKANYCLALHYAAGWGANEDAKKSVCVFTKSSGSKR